MMHPTNGRAAPRGAIERHLSPGARIGCRGLSAGDGWGTLGLLARDRATGRLVGLTAMHVLAARPCRAGPPVRVHAVDRAGDRPRRLGVLLRGTHEGVDAAAVRLRRGLPVSAFLPGIGVPRAARTPDEGDLERSVRFFGAGTGFATGRIVGVAQRFAHDRLDDAFLVEIPCRAGDSGGACVDADGRVLGLHVGALRARPGVQVFCAAEAVLRALDCELP